MSWIINIILIILKKKSLKVLGYYIGQNHFLIKNPYCRCITLIFTHNYVNMSWESSNKTNLRKHTTQQKHTIRFVNNKGHFEHTTKLFKS